MCACVCLWSIWKCTFLHALWGSLKVHLGSHMKVSLSLFKGFNHKVNHNRQLIKGISCMLSEHLTRILQCSFCLFIVTETRQSILGSDGMTKSDCSLALWVLLKYSLSALWLLSESLVLKMMKIESLKQLTAKWTDGQIDRDYHSLSSCQSQKLSGISYQPLFSF